MNNFNRKTKFKGCSKDKALKIWKKSMFCGGPGTPSTFLLSKYDKFSNAQRLEILDTLQKMTLDERHVLTTLDLALSLDRLYWELRRDDKCGYFNFNMQACFNQVKSWVKENE